MFRGLRLRLTALYLLTATLLLAGVGVGARQFVSNYFHTTTDLALQHKMADEFRFAGAALPPELAAADHDWYVMQGRPVPPGPHATDGSGGQSPSYNDDNHDKQYPGAPGAPGGGRTAEVFDGELAAVFVLPLDSSGQVLSQNNAGIPAPLPDAVALAAAWRDGSDLRTVRLETGPAIRLLTYRMPAGVTPAVLQLGRTLDDQEHALNQLVLALLGLGGISTVLLGFGSWWLAGRALQPAQAAWARQQAFVANASHELRTPLTLVRATTEVARRSLPAADADNQALLGDVLQECDHMNRLVEDLLLLSRLDAGRLKLERQAIDLPALLTDVQRQVGRIADERGVRLVVEATGGAVWGDPTRLRQVLLILLDNALRYTPRDGTITLAAQPQGRQVRLSVADTGQGIAPDRLAHVFERFYRADDTPSGLATGTGLGLSIARGLVEAQHGHIGIESHLGAGTRVTLTLLSGSPPGPRAGAGRRPAGRTIDDRR